MGRLKKSTKASRDNGALFAKRHSKKPVATLSLERYEWEQRDEGACEDADDVVVKYRAKPKKGHFWADELHFMATAMMQQKNVHFESPPPEKKDKHAARLEWMAEYEKAQTKAANRIRELNKDTASKAGALKKYTKVLAGRK